MLDHVSIPVKDFDESRQFYEQVLGTLGAKVVMEWPGLVLLGTDDGMVAISEKDQVAPLHIAFKADRAGVQAFYDAALAAGASDNGPPSVRSDIHPNYYAAFAARTRPHRRGIGARARLGQRVGAKPFTGRQPRQPAGLLLRVARELQPQRTELLHGEDQPARRADLRDLLDRDERE